MPFLATWHASTPAEMPCLVLCYFRDTPRAYIASYGDPGGRVS